MRPFRRLGVLAEIGYSDATAMAQPMPEAVRDIRAGFSNKQYPGHTGVEDQKPVFTCKCFLTRSAASPMGTTANAITVY